MTVGSRPRARGTPALKRRRITRFLPRPITGYFVKGHKRVQYNWDVDASIESASLWTDLFVREPKFVWPHLWIDDWDVVSDKSAKKFVDSVYAPVALAWGFAIALGCLGVLLCLAACWVYRMQGEGYKPPAGEAVQLESAELAAMNARA